MEFIYNKTITLNKMLKDCEEFKFKNIERVLILPNFVKVTFS